MAFGKGADKAGVLFKLLLIAGDQLSEERAVFPVEDAVVLGFKKRRFGLGFEGDPTVPPDELIG